MAPTARLRARATCSNRLGASNSLPIANASSSEMGLCALKHTKNKVEIDSGSELIVQRLIQLTGDGTCLKSKFCKHCLCCLMSHLHTRSLDHALLRKRHQQFSGLEEVYRWQVGGN